MTNPVQLRDSNGGVAVYYALPVLGGEFGVFEHIATWPSRADAEASITELQDADARRTSLAAGARSAIEAWRTAAGSGSWNEEHDAARDVAGLLDTIVGELASANLIYHIR